MVNVSHLFHDRLVWYFTAVSTKQNKTKRNGHTFQVLWSKVIVSMNICLQFCNVHYFHPLTAPLSAMLQQHSLLIHFIEHFDSREREPVRSNVWKTWAFSSKSRFQAGISKTSKTKCNCFFRTGSEWMNFARAWAHSHFTKSCLKKKLHKKRQRKKPNN